MHSTRQHYGLTLVELTVTMVLLSIVMLAVGVVLVQVQKNWQRAYETAHGEVANDAHVARVAFEKLTRGASQSEFIIDPAGQWAEVTYRYADPLGDPDRYARFYLSGGSQLMVEHGIIEPRETLRTEVLARNVTMLRFEQHGVPLQMQLTLSRGNDSTTVLTSAVMHNE
jgi:prepilin-type N-terminal cleavage/methylation domain-containing protein